MDGHACLQAPEALEPSQARGQPRVRHLMSCILSMLTSWSGLQDMRCSPLLVPVLYEWTPCREAALVRLWVPQSLIIDEGLPILLCTRMTLPEQSCMQAWMVAGLSVLELYLVAAALRRRQHGHEASNFAQVSPGPDWGLQGLRGASMCCSYTKS